MGTNELTFRKAENNEADKMRLFAIKCDAENVRWSGFKSAPKLDVFSKWYEKQFVEHQHEIWLAFLDTQCIGFFYIIHKSDDLAESGHGLLSSYAGRGFGSQIISRCASEMYGGGYKYYEGWIAEDNIGSRRNVEKIGLVATSETEERTLYDDDGSARKVLFRRWLKKL